MAVKSHNVLCFVDVVFIRAPAVLLLHDEDVSEHRGDGCSDAAATRHDVDAVQAVDVNERDARWRRFE